MERAIQKDIMKTPIPLTEGMIVWLASGGPPMTIVKIKTGMDGYVECVWFNDDDFTCEHRFPVSALKSKIPAKAK